MEEKKDYRKELFYEKKNGYDSMDAAARAAMEDYCEGYKAYLNDSRTEREAVTNAIRLAEREGFVEYKPGMSLKAGDKVIVEGLQKIRPGSPVRIAEPTPVKQGAPASEKR